MVNPIEDFDRVQDAEIYLFTSVEEVGEVFHGHEKVRETGPCSQEAMLGVAENLVFMKVN